LGIFFHECVNSRARVLSTNKNVKRHFMLRFLHVNQHTATRTA
jgi:hypothetical protein